MNKSILGIVVPLGHLYNGHCLPGDSIATPEEISAWEASQAPTYQQLRAAEYPPITDYLDAVVKGDKAAIKEYTNACLAVKEKYPKPKA